MVLVCYLFNMEVYIFLLENDFFCVWNLLFLMFLIDVDMVSYVNVCWFFD